MQDELDPLLSRLFAESREALPPEVFLQALEIRLGQVRRLRLLSRVGALIALAIVAAVAAPFAAYAMLTLAEYSLESAVFSTALLSLLGVLTPMVLSLCVLRRLRARLA